MVASISVIFALSILSALAVLLIFIGIFIPLGDGTFLKEDEFGRVVEKKWSDITILQEMARDLSKLIRPDKGDLHQRIVKSGHRFKTEAEYHSKRILFSFGALAVIILAGILYNLSFVILALVASVGTIFGFLLPDILLQEGIKIRRDAFFKSMTFGIQQMALILLSGADEITALQSVSHMGLFGEVCNTIAFGLNNKQSMDKITKQIVEDMPESPDLEEFHDLLKISIGSKGADLTKPLMKKAEMMRKSYKNEITKAGQNAINTVTMINTGISTISSMIIILTPLMMSLNESGVF